MPAVFKMKQSVTVRLCKGNLKRFPNVSESTFNVKCMSIGKSKKSFKQIQVVSVEKFERVR